MATRHIRADLEGKLELFIKAGVGGSAMTLTSASGPNFQDADISFADNGTGDHTITVNPFKLPAAEVYAQATAVSAASKLFCTIKSIAYTNDSLAIEILTFTDAGTATEPDSVFLHLFAC